MQNKLNIKRGEDKFKMQKKNKPEAYKRPADSKR